MFVNRMITFLSMPVKDDLLSYNKSAQICIVSAKGIYVKRLAMSKEHIKVSCGLVVKFRIFPEKVKEPLMQRTEYRSSTS